MGWSTQVTLRRRFNIQRRNNFSLPNEGECIIPICKLMNTRTLEFSNEDAKKRQKHLQHKHSTAREEYPCVRQTMGWWQLQYRNRCFQWVTNQLWTHTGICVLNIHQAVRWEVAQQCKHWSIDALVHGATRSMKKVFACVAVESTRATLSFSKTWWGLQM